jgi:hypothetical protein
MIVERYFNRLSKAFKKGQRIFKALIMAFERSFLKAFERPFNGI